MDRYVGLDAHAETCTLAVVGPSGRRLTSRVVETNGQALVEAIRSIPGRVHLCLEEGTQSAWLHEILEPQVSEIVVTMPPETQGREGRPAGRLGAGGRTAGGGDPDAGLQGTEASGRAAQRGARVRMATQDVVRAKNRLKAVFLRARHLADAGVYDAEAPGGVAEEAAGGGTASLRSGWGGELDELVPLREEAEELAAEGSRRRIRSSAS